MRELFQLWQNTISKEKISQILNIANKNHYLTHLFFLHTGPCKRLEGVKYAGYQINGLKCYYGNMF